MSEWVMLHGKQTDLDKLRPEIRDIYRADAEAEKVLKYNIDLVIGASSPGDTITVVCDTYIVNLNDLAQWFADIMKSSGETVSFQKVPPVLSVEYGPVFSFTNEVASTRSANRKPAGVLLVRRDQYPSGGNIASDETLELFEMGIGFVDVIDLSGK